jgi:hypothetical protein
MILLPALVKRRENSKEWSPLLQSHTILSILSKGQALVGMMFSNESPRILEKTVLNITKVKKKTKPKKKNEYREYDSFEKSRRKNIRISKKKNPSWNDQ